MYLCQEGGGEGGEKEHIYNHPKGGLVPPPKEGSWLGGGGGGCWDNGGLVRGKYGIGGSSGRVVGVRVVWL